jgi:quercetin dioxygenase-like cupin family protein
MAIGLIVPKDKWCNLDVHRRAPDVYNEWKQEAYSMIKRSVQQMDGISIEGDGIKGVTMKLLAGTDDSAPTFAMRHFTVEPGGFTPKHDHPWEHEVFVLSGQGEVECDGEVQSVQGGDSLFIPSNNLHQFRNLGELQFEFLCIVPVESECGEPVPGS